jgi:hypothetical protein
MDDSLVADVRDALDVLRRINEYEELFGHLPGRIECGKDLLGRLDDTSWGFMTYTYSRDVGTQRFFRGVPICVIEQEQRCNSDISSAIYRVRLVGKRVDSVVSTTDNVPNDVLIPEITYEEFIAVLNAGLGIKT